jgi:TfoX/Sxy family transcriptional regulator of competence genes
MASDKRRLAFVLDQMSGVVAVTARPMFGEYGLYGDGKIVALFCDNQLFVKPTEPGKSFLGTPVEASPYPGAKPYFLANDLLDDRERLSELIRRTARALPPLQKK